MTFIIRLGSFLMADDVRGSMAGRDDAGSGIERIVTIIKEVTLCKTTPTELPLTLFAT